MTDTKSRRWKSVVIWTVAVFTLCASFVFAGIFAMMFVAGVFTIIFILVEFSVHWFSGQDNVGKLPVGYRLWAKLTGQIVIRATIINRNLSIYAFANNGLCYIKKYPRIWPWDEEQPVGPPQYLALCGKFTDGSLLDTWELAK